MSLDATRWAWQQSVKPTQKLVLLSLADRAGEDHTCYPSTARLVSDTGLYRETIFKAISELEQLGLLKVKRELGKGNFFTLIGVNERHKTSSEKPTSRNKPTSSEKPTPTSSDKPTTQSVKADTYQSVKADTESTIESTNNLSIESKKKKVNYFEGLDEQIVNDYLAVRKAKRAPAVNKTVVKGLVREADKAGYTLEEALQTCCERNWVGFNADWVSKPTATKGFTNARDEGRQAAAKSIFKPSTTQHLTKEIEVYDEQQKLTA